MKRLVLDELDAILRDWRRADERSAEEEDLIGMLSFVTTQARRALGGKDH